MKKLAALGIAFALAFLASCGKQQSEAEKNAEIERQVQQRLAAERQTDEQQKLAQREADLKAREDALAQEKQAPAPTATPQMRAADVQQRQETEAETGEPASYNTFYTKLEPYGDWRETSDYGYVFQPNEAGRSRNWRPYTNGRWVYTDAGWTWDSDEPFGWATYHYGRWARLRSVGWVWIPGDEWAPAWVSWRKGNDYVGWAPLPPEARFDRERGIHNGADNDYDIGPDQYCFVPATDLGAQRIEGTIVPVERNVTIVNQTVNVTNITYTKTAVVNQGPNYEELLRGSRHPVQRLRLDRRQRFENANSRAVVNGEVIQMPAPAIARAQPADRPRKVKEKIARPELDHGWADIRDKKAADQARAKMKAEATTPRGTPPAKIAASQTPPPNELVQPAGTPVRNYPERKKTKPHALGAMSPGIKATPSPARAMPPASPHPNPVMTPTPAPTVPKRPAPAISPTPRMTTPYAQERQEQTPPTSVKKQEGPGAIVPSGREPKKGDKDKRNNKPNRQSPSPSPATPER